MSFMMTERLKNHYHQMKLEFTKLIYDAPYAYQREHNGRLEYTAPTRSEAETFLASVNDHFKGLDNDFIRNPTPVIASPNHTSMTWNGQFCYNTNSVQGVFMAIGGQPFIEYCVKHNYRGVASYMMFGAGSYLVAYGSELLDQIRIAAKATLNEKIDKDVTPSAMRSLASSTYKKACNAYLKADTNAKMFLTSYFAAQNLYFYAPLILNERSLLASFTEAFSDDFIQGKPKEPKQVNNNDIIDIIDIKTPKFINWIKGKVRVLARNIRSKLATNNDFEMVSLDVSVESGKDPLPPSDVSDSSDTPPASSIASGPDEEKSIEMREQKQEDNDVFTQFVNERSDNKSLENKTPREVVVPRLMARKGFWSKYWKEKHIHIHLLLVSHFFVEEFCEVKCKNKEKIQKFFNKTTVSIRKALLGEETDLFREFLEYLDSKTKIDMAVAVCYIAYLAPCDEILEYQKYLPRHLKAIMERSVIMEHRLADNYKQHYESISGKNKDRINYYLNGLAAMQARKLANKPLPSIATTVSNDVAPSYTTVAPPPPPSAPTITSEGSDASSTQITVDSDLLEWWKSTLLDARQAIINACSEKFTNYIEVYLQTVTHNHVAATVPQQYSSLLAWKKTAVKSVN